MNVSEIEQLMRALAQYGLSELKLEQGDCVLKLTRGEVPAPRSEQSAPRPEQEIQTPVPAVKEKGTAVCSPIVGTFYSCPTPDAEPFVRAGDEVHKGDVLFIIESMKLMNEVTSELDGTVVEIMAHSGDPVEYGQPLMRIEAH